MRFYPLIVSELKKSTQDSTIVSFDVPEQLREQFKYNAGQYLAIKAKIDGEEIRRSYSLCSSPLDETWQIGVKKVDEGKMSSFINNTLKVGDTLDVAAPDGRFFVPIEKNRQINNVAFAAGSGITPIISLINTHLRSGPGSTFKLFYVNQTALSIILKEELEALKNIYLDRLGIFYFLTREFRNLELLNGRLDKGKLDTIFRSLCDHKLIDHYFICGPEPMIFMIRDFLKALGIDKKSIHFELFQSTGIGSAVKKKLSMKLKGKISNVVVHEGGKSFNFQMIQGSGNLLDAALANSADLPFACKGGVCCTCKAKLIQGNIEMMVNYGLEKEEVDEGYVLTCQSIPVSENIEINFDS